MANIEAKPRSDGGASVTVEVAPGQVRQWNVGGEQVDKHAETFKDAGVAAGDISAMRDASNEARKQRES